MFQVFKKMFEEVARQSLFHKYTINEDGRGVWNDKDISNKDHLLDLGIDLDDFDTRKMIILSKHDNYVGAFYKTRDGKYICIEIGADYADDDRYFKYIAKRLLNEYNYDRDNDEEIDDRDIDTDNSADKFNHKNDDDDEYNDDDDYDIMKDLDFNWDEDDENNNDDNDEDLDNQEETEEQDNNDTDNNDDLDNQEEQDDSDNDNENQNTDDDEIDFGGDSDNEEQDDSEKQSMPNSQIAPNKKEGKKDAKQEEQDNLNKLKESLTQQINELIKSYEKMFGAFEIKTDEEDKD